MGDRVTAPEIARDLLERARNADGGYGPSPGAPSEPEPTALAAIALDDADARAWLGSHQRDDGSFGLVEGYVRDVAATGLVALALGEGEPRERALDHLESLEGERIRFSDTVPMDGEIPAWPWTDDTFTWVEPTSRAILALKRFRPTSPRIAQGVAMLRDRRSIGGGWNYGNSVVLGEELPPFAHTTAIAILALWRVDATLAGEATDLLKALWRAERAGPISLAMSRVVYMLVGDDAEIEAIDEALEDATSSPVGLLEDTVAAAWIALATGPGLAEVIPP